MFDDSLLLRVAHALAEAVPFDEWIAVDFPAAAAS
jgi:hypothetical protein